MRLHSRDHEWEVQLNYLKLIRTPKLSPVNQTRDQSVVRFQYDTLSPSSFTGIRTSKLPIKLDFPKFGGDSKTNDSMTYIELQESLDLRPKPDNEILATSLC